MLTIWILYFHATYWSERFSDLLLVTACTTDIINLEYISVVATARLCNEYLTLTAMTCFTPFSVLHRNFSEWSFHFRMSFHIHNAVCNMECRFHSEDCVPVSERRFSFRILHFIFRMRFIFQNIAFLFLNVVCVSECRLLFGIAVSVSEYCVSFSECGVYFRILRFYFRMSFLFQNVVYFSELRWPLCATIWGQCRRYRPQGRIGPESTWLHPQAALWDMPIDILWTCVTLSVPGRKLWKGIIK